MASVLRHIGVWPWLLLTLAFASSAVAGPGPEQSEREMPGRLRIAALSGPNALSHDPGRDELAFAKGSSPLEFDASVFGSVPLRIQTTVHSGKWFALMREEAHTLLSEGCESNDRTCDSAAFQELRQVVRTVATAPLAARIAAVNAAVNQLVTYGLDEAVHGQRDHWASFRETMRLGQGDCEDIALVKFWALVAVGVPKEQMHLLLAKTSGGDRDHALLVVRVEGEKLVLDNRSAGVARESAVRGYTPLVSLGVTRTWIHGVRRSS